MGVKWTEEETRMVDRLAGYYPAAEIVQKVQAYQKRKGLKVRTDRAICCKISELNKTHRPLLNNVSSQELGRILGISGQTIRWWVHNKGLPARKVGKSHAIDLKDLLKWMLQYPHLVSRIEEDSLRWVIAQADEQRNADQIVAKIKAVKPSIDFTKPVAVRNLRTGAEYPSICAAAKAEFVSRRSIANRIRGVQAISPRVDVDFKII